MSGATRSTPALYLPDVEANHQPGIYRDLIASARGRNAEYSKIWDLFAYQQSFTIHLARFTQGVLRQPATISPGLRELVAAYTSYQNECGFCTQAHAAAASVYNRWITATGVPVMSVEGHRQQGKALAARGYVRD